MHDVIMSLINRYRCNSVEDYENALKEIIQEIALLGMWRAKFFEIGAFYGGSALRILFNLNRFSEDMDFSLLKPSKDFNIADYEKSLCRELSAFGFEVSVEKKTKSLQTPIESAFIKANTLVHLLKIRADLKTHPDALLKIKVEVDKEPPGGEETQVISHFRPVPYSVKTFTLPTLFAGKITATLFRPYKNNVKGRDWYDFLWYVSKNIPVNLTHFKARAVQIDQWPKEKNLALKDLVEMLQAKIADLDIQKVIKDVLPFVEDKAIVSAWTKELFLDATNLIEVAHEGMRK
jgi:predicted nucleotidyltransferase component of viral defense system